MLTINYLFGVELNSTKCLSVIVCSTAAPIVYEIWYVGASYLVRSLKPEKGFMVPFTQKAPAGRYLGQKASTIHISDNMLSFMRHVVPTHKEKNDETENVYRAMMNHDLSEAVLGHKKTSEFYEQMQTLQLIKDEKSEEISNSCRQQGNAHFKHHNYQQALVLYNRALLFAPDKSLAMKFAYSNRSLVFIENQLASACLKDIETCLSLGCPPDLKSKLLDRKKQATQVMQKEHFMKFLRFNNSTMQFFKLGSNRCPDIPCAIADIQVIMENHQPKVVAKNDIKAGTIIAIETAYVNTPHECTQYYCCYYCNKLTLNLIPCAGCSRALFCNEECRRLCLTQYHSIECSIINKINTCLKQPSISLAFKATLRIKNETKTWDKFIEASNIMGNKRIESGSVNDVFDSKNISSLLSFAEDEHFVFGKMYNSGANCAYIINKLEELLPSFFPQAPESRKAAISAFARVLLYLTVYGRTVPLVLAVTNLEAENTFIHQYNMGLFGFCGKLRMSCKANALTVSLNKELAVVALQDIPAGAELTVPFIENWLLPDDVDDKNKFTFHLYDAICDCTSCNKRDGESFQSKLNDLQKRTLKTLNFKRMNEEFNNTTVKEIFNKLCAKVNVFQDMPYTEDNPVYTLMRKCILLMQDQVTDNKILGD